MPVKTFLFAILIFIGGLLANPVAAQDIGVLGGSSEPAPVKPNKPSTPKRNIPRHQPEKAAPTRPKRRVSITITTDPAECEVYLNDTYRGTTAARNGKLIVPDLDTSLSYTLRIYKRGLGEDLQQLDLNDDLDLNVSLKKPGNLPDNGGNVVADNPSEKQPNGDLHTEKEPGKSPDIASTVKSPVLPKENKTPDTTPIDPPKPVIKPPGSEMVLIPAGEFNMGGNNKKQIDNERPQHKVMVSAFFIDIYEVTNAEYKLFCDATNRPYPNNPKWDNDYFSAKPSHPVVNVSWDDANAYAQWVGKRLPTEEEWEKAARGTDSREWPWGKDFQPTLANFMGMEDGYEFTAPVGSFRNGMSPYGVYDLAGNVWEWTASAFKPYPGGQISDNRFLNGNFRVIRGGGYNAPSIGIRSILFRFPSEPNQVYEATGFRCARSQ